MRARENVKHGTLLGALVVVSFGCSPAGEGTDVRGSHVTPSMTGGSGGNAGAASGGAGAGGAGTGGAGGTGVSQGGASGAGGSTDTGAGPPMNTPDSGAGGSTATADAGSDTPPGMAPPPTTGSCPSPPQGAPANAVQAWTVLNQTRLAAGSGCMNLVAALDTSAQSHCNYEASNKGNSTCTSDAHGEVMSCTGFTGADVQSREVAAGYPQSLAYTEVLTTYGNNPTSAVPSWIDTVFHRIPLLDPWTVDMGYGGAVGCDVIDIGRGNSSSVAAGTIVVYPYDGQTNVPPAFSGLEGPTPPAPAGGWPSSYPISIYAQGLNVTSHVLTKDGSSTPIDHLWLDGKSSQISTGLKPYFVDTAFLYGAAFDLSTKYRVKIVGTHTGGALNAEWTFTTGATRPYGT